MSDDEPICVTCIGPPVAYAPHQFPPEIQAHYDEWLAACRRVWEATQDPLIIAAAVRHTSFYRQPIASWLEEAVVQASIKGRTKADVRRQRERTNHIKRWLLVKDLKGVKG